MSTPKTDSENKATFFMPREEQFFFRHFHPIAAILVLIVFCVRFFVSQAGAVDAFLYALSAAVPLYLFQRIYAQRFAQSVTLDFDEQTVLFSFGEQRDAFKRRFTDICKIRFGFYLTFVMDDGCVMVKRPVNKKETFQLLQKVGRLEIGVFSGY